MPYDPSLPQENTPVDAAQMRGQLNGLKELIDAVPAGPPGLPGLPGAPGVQGPPFANAVVEAVTTVPAGGAATVSVFFDGTDVHLPLASRRQRGRPRPGRPPGPQGPQGPPFANATIDSVGTLNPGDNATVSVFFDGNTVHFSFGIPRGAQGEQGIQGPPGEVTNAALAGAIAGTAQNPNGIAPFGGSFSDPPTQAELMAFAAYVETLRSALVR